MQGKTLAQVYVLLHLAIAVTGIGIGLASPAGASGRAVPQH